MLHPHVVIGAGPAGLTAAWELVKLKERVIVLEADPRYVGGIARTVEYKGYRFDMGGHRFYSKSDAINRLWREMMPDDWVEVNRLSRIFFRRHFFPYPIAIGPTLRGLGMWQSTRIVASYAHAQIHRRVPEDSFEDWMVNRFGYLLYETFFKTYSEKVWGIPCSQMNKDWAVQRIRGLSLGQAVRNAFKLRKSNGVVKTLLHKFVYPRLGPGQLWEAVQRQVERQGGRVLLDKNVVRVRRHQNLVVAVETEDGESYSGTHFYSTMPLRDLINAIQPPPPAYVVEAANALRYRDFLTVAVIVDTPSLFPDNWIYVHDPGVHVGRIQNYKNWSPDMVADPARTCLGLEYFCSRGDGFWDKPDDELLQLAIEELEQLGLAERARCIDGCVVRVPNAYPVYDQDYRRHVDTLKEWLNQSLTNLHPAGRGGLHNYNSQDHSMMAAILSVRKVQFGDVCDVWAINTDREYSEEGEDKQFDGRLVPTPLVPRRQTEPLLVHSSQPSSEAQS